jgi:hypothetical protein
MELGKRKGGDLLPNKTTAKKTGPLSVSFLYYALEDLPDSISNSF